MASNFTDWIKNELYPACFECLDSVIPQLDFKRIGNKWGSRLGIDGRKPNTDRPDKTVSTPKYIGRIYEQGTEKGEDYISVFRRFNNVRDVKEATDQMAALAHIEPYKFNADPAKYEAERKEQEAMHAVKRAMQDALKKPENEAVLNYLTEGRGYDKGFIDFAELGVLTTDMPEYMTIKELTKTNWYYGIGRQNILSIPYRSNGRLLGFVFRSILTDEQVAQLPDEQRKDHRKYADVFLNDNASKKYHLFGLTGLRLTGTKKYITIVEGELDALRAQYEFEKMAKDGEKDLPYIVAVGSSGLSTELLTSAKRYRVEGVNILFDTEATADGRSSMAGKIDSTIEKIQLAGLDSYIATLPSPTDQKTDVNSYLQDGHSGRDLNRIINEAKSGAQWKFNALCATYSDVTGADGDMPSEDIRRIKEFDHEFVKLYKKPYWKIMDRMILRQTYADTMGRYLTESEIDTMFNEVEQENERVWRKEMVKSMRAEEDRLNREGTADDILNFWEKQLPEIRRHSREAKFHSMLATPQKGDLARAFKEVPTGLPTGLSVRSQDGSRTEEFLLPVAALTYICGATSHGKTRLLENLAVSLALNDKPEDDPTTNKGDVLYLTFEEDVTATKMELLNIYADMDIFKNNIKGLTNYFRRRDTDTSQPEDYKGKDWKGDEAKLRKAESEFEDLLKDGKIRIFYGVPTDRGDNGKFSDDVVDAVRYLAGIFKVKAVLIDYVQRLYKKGNKLVRKDELRDICDDLMSLSVETKLPIVLAAQLNRQAASPVDMAPQNIADASDIEHSANVVLMMWNSAVKPLPNVTNSYYFGTVNSSTGEQDMTLVAKKLQERTGFKIGDAGKLYAVLAKNRGGERNMEAAWNFNGNTGKITCPPFTEQTQQVKTDTVASSGDTLLTDKEDLPF